MEQNICEKTAENLGFVGNHNFIREVQKQVPAYVLV